MKLLIWTINGGTSVAFDSLFDSHLLSQQQPIVLVAVDGLFSLFRTETWSGDRRAIVCFSMSSEMVFIKIPWLSMMKTKTSSPNESRFQAFSTRQLKRKLSRSFALSRIDLERASVYSILLEFSFHLYHLFFSQMTVRKHNGLLNPINFLFDLRFQALPLPR